MICRWVEDFSRWGAEFGRWSAAFPRWSAAFRRRGPHGRGPQETPLAAKPRDRPELSQTPAGKDGANGAGSEAPARGERRAGFPASQGSGQQKSREGALPPAEEAPRDEGHGERGRGERSGRMRWCSSKA